MSWPIERINFQRLKPAKAAEDHALHIAAVEWSLADPIVITGKQDIKSAANWRDRFEPYDHQVQNLIRFCRMLPATLLADDVGLGKTISAGLVLAELLERKRVARCLVICPAILGPQWVEEMGSKFGIPGVFATGQELTNVIERSAVPVVVTTYQSVSGRIASLRPGQFEMVILDEAHKLRNLHGTKTPPQMAQRIRAALEARTFKYVLMLTATPIQNRVWDLYSLLDLLTAAKGHKNPLGSPAEFDARYLDDKAGRKLNRFNADAFRSILRQYVVRTRREDALLTFPTRLVETHKLQGTAIERRMAEVVADTIGSLNAFAQTSLSQAMMSSPHALASQLENMSAKGSVSPSVAAEVRRLADTGASTAKLDGLLTLVRALRAENPRDWRVVVFTLRKETQDAIGRALSAEGIAVEFIRGGSSHANQAAVERFRAAPPKANVIVSTDAGAEGVNLQAGNVLVNFDLPWNPMVMEQRIGRIQRLASTHANVNVVNLVIANSVEERVVGRLLAKLQAVSETIGDIETILEGAGQDEDGSFEEMVRKLVVNSLVGQDVEQATRAATASIDRAKARMEEERGTIEEMFGPGALDPKQATKPPKLEPVRPSIPAEQFVMRALTAEGAMVRPKGDDTIDVLRAGHPPERITFKPEAAERDGTGVFMGNAPKLALPGRPYFERLVERWLQRSAHAVRDLSTNVEALTLMAVRDWCDSIPDATFDSFKVIGSQRRLMGGVTCKIKAANGVDSLEKVIRVEASPDQDGLSGVEGVTAFPMIADHLAADASFEGVEGSIAASAVQDRDIDAFCRFYENRRIEEIGKAGSDPRQRHKVETDFSPQVFADVVAMSGLRYDIVRATVAFLVDGEHQYEAELRLVPATKRVLDQPPRLTCSLTGRDLPSACIEKCSVSGRLATAHMLVRSNATGRFALPDLTVRCDLTGDLLLRDEARKSDVSGRISHASRFAQSPASGRWGLEDDEVGSCQITGVRRLADELLLSDVSGKRFRADEAASSALSGKVGHRSEMAKCAVSGDPLLPTELGRCEVTGQRVRQDWLVASQKPPYRHGERSQIIRCEVTGRSLLRDEVVPSAVSGRYVDKDVACRSEISERPALPDEMVTCTATGKRLLPEEAGASAVSGRVVDRNLLVASPVSGRTALLDEFKACEFTQELVLPDELSRSDESGRWFRSDQVARSEISGRIGHESESTLCNGTAQRVLLSETELSAMDGQRYVKSLIVRSEKPPHRLGTKADARHCAISDKLLLSDEVVPSAVSGELMDRDLAASSDISGQPALPEELVRCEETGQRLLPSESSRCAITGKVVRSDLLAASAVSGRRALAMAFAPCEITGASVLKDELILSDESGRPFRKDEAVASAASGLVGHRSEMVECSGLRGPILKRESGRSAMSGKTYSKSLLLPSEKNPERLGLKDELVLCTKTGKRLLRDEAVESAVSRQWIDRDLAVPSTRSGRVALQEELVPCEETGALLLPVERDRCALTGKLVDKWLLKPSDLSGKLAVASRLATCPISGKVALPAEFQPCAISGQRVDPAELETCTVSHKRALRSYFVRSDISGAPMLVEHAVRSPLSKRCCTPKEASPCSWHNAVFPRDELTICRLTGLSFARAVVNGENELRPLRDLLDGKEAGADASDAVGWLLKARPGVVTGLKTARCAFSPDGSVRAICGETRALLGLKVRHVGLLVGESPTRQVLGRVVLGRRIDAKWTQEA